MGKSRAKAAIYTLAFILLATNAISPAMSSLSRAMPGVSAVAIQNLLQLPMLMSVPFILFGGVISKKISRKKLILVALAMFTLGGCTGFFTENIVVLIVSRGIYGIGYGILVPCSLGIAADLYYGTEEYDKVIGMEYSLKSIGSIFFTTAAGFLCALGWHNVFLLYLTGAVVFICMLFFVPDVKQVDTDEATSVTPQRRLPAVLILASLLAFCCSFCVSVNNGNLSYLVEDDLGGTSFLSGLIMSLCTLAAAAGSGLYASILKKLKDHTLTMGIIIVLSGLLCGGLANNMLSACLCVALLGFGLGITNPALLMLVGRIHKDASTLYFSFIMAAMNLGSMAQGTLIPLIAKWSFGGSGLGRSAYLVAFFGELLCLAGELLFIRHSRKYTPAQ